MSDISSIIKEQIASHKVVLYMKGTAEFPQCGFSGRAVKILSEIGVNEFFTVNVLENDAIRQGIKEYSHWPTIPQLYINGEFIGGSDIMLDMYESGELKELVQKIR